MIVLQAQQIEAGYVGDGHVLQSWRAVDAQSHDCVGVVEFVVLCLWRLSTDGVVDVWEDDHGEDTQRGRS